MWLGLRVDSRLCAVLHSSNDQWTLAMTFSGHDDSTINIVLGLLLLLLRKNCATYALTLSNAKKNIKNIVMGIPRCGIKPVSKKRPVKQMSNNREKRNTWISILKQAKAPSFLKADAWCHSVCKVRSQKKQKVAYHMSVKNESRKMK